MATSSEQSILDVVRRLVAQRVEHTIRYSISGGIGCLIGGAFCLGIAGFILAACGPKMAAIPALLILGLGLYGAYNLIRALVHFADRSPKLILGLEALIDCRADRVEIPWTNIREATMNRTLRNGSEVSATLVLKFHLPVEMSFTREIEVTNFDCSGQWLFNIVATRANLS
jgi:hypothetical protein